MVGLRFKSDKVVPDTRFETYKREFGGKFEAIELEERMRVHRRGLRIRC